MTHDTSGGSWREFWLALDRWLNTWFGGRGLRDHCDKAAHGAAIPRETKKPPPAILPPGKIDPATRRRLENLVAKKAARRPRPPQRPTEAP